MTRVNLGAAGLLSKWPLRFCVDNDNRGDGAEKPWARHWGLACQPSSAGTCWVAFGECPQCCGPLAFPSFPGDGDGGTLEHSVTQASSVPAPTPPLLFLWLWGGWGWYPWLPAHFPTLGLLPSPPSSPPSALGTRQAGCGPALPYRVLVSVRKSQR